MWAGLGARPQRASEGLGREAATASSGGCVWHRTPVRGCHSNSLMQTTGPGCGCGNKRTKEGDPVEFVGVFPWCLGPSEKPISQTLILRSKFHGVGPVATQGREIPLPSSSRGNAKDRKGVPGMTLIRLKRPNGAASIPGGVRKKASRPCWPLLSLPRAGRGGH